MAADNRSQTPEAKDEVVSLRARGSELERKLQRCETDRLQLQASYEEALQSLADSEAKRESSERELKLAHDQISSMWKELESVRKKLDENVMKTTSSVSRTQSVLDGKDIAELHCTLCNAKIRPEPSTSVSITTTASLKLSPTLKRKGSWFFGKRKRIEELDGHSKICSMEPATTSNLPPNKSQPDVASVRERKVHPDPVGVVAKDKKQSSHPSSVPKEKVVIEDFLQVNVTRSPPGEPGLAPFKVITKTNISQFNQTPLEVHRSQADIQWLYEVLLDSCPERAIPPLKPPISLDATVSEFQRFLSRIAAHKVLRRHHMFITFLSGSTEELRTLRAKHRLSQEMVQFQPAVGRDTKSGPLVATKEYLMTLEHHLQGLALHMDQSNRTKSSTDRIAHWFRALSESEPAETYLKIATGDLARTCESAEGHQIEADDTLFIQSLQSIADYVKAAQDLLTRVEEAVDKFLYWDEEVSIMEAVTSANPSSTQQEATTEETREETSTTGYDDSGASDITTSSGHSKNSTELNYKGHTTQQDQADKNSDGNSISERWAEASKYCSDAKDYLEMMCKDLADELAQFDLRKETELKQVLLDYALAQLEKHEKFRGKWFAMRYLLDTEIKPSVRAIKFNSNAEQKTSAPDKVSS